MKKILLLISFICLTSAFGTEIRHVKQKYKSISNIIDSSHFSINIGYYENIWVPLYRENYSILEFSSEGLQTYHFAASFGIDNIDFLNFDYQRPRFNTPNQKEMLKINSAKTHGLEKYSAGIKLDALANRFLSFDNAFMKLFISRLFSIKFTYRKELYFGNAVCEKDFYFVKIDDSFKSESGDYSNYLHVNAGDELSFKILFDDYKISVLIAEMKDQELRIGYSTSTWSRPSDYYTYYLKDSGKYVIFASRFEGRGFLLHFIARNRSAPGLHMDVFLTGKMFTDCFIYTADGELSKIFEQEDDSWLTYKDYKISIWYNWYLNKSAAHGLFGSLGIEFEQRIWGRGYSSEKEGEDAKIYEIESDNFIRLFAEISWKF